MGMASSPCAATLNEAGPPGKKAGQGYRPLAFAAGPAIIAVRPHGRNGMAVHLDERTLRVIGWCATVTAILMYGSYLDQIRMNLAGEKGAVIQPLATVFNTCLWTAYGWLHKEKDWPIIVANVPGIVLGATCLYTALY
jgi:uncharacterized protein with PQ loop repeat